MMDWIYGKVLFVFLMVLMMKICLAGFSGKPSCLDTLSGAYRIEMPFINISRTNRTSEGIIPQIFEKAMRACCRGEFQIDYDQQFETQGQVIEILKNFTIHFALPIQKDHKSKKHLHNPFVSIVQSPGLAFYVVGESSIGKEIMNALMPSWSVFALLLVLVAISGSIYALIEMISLSLDGEEYPAFHQGVWAGIWWAFVSMTTVGYGDICPKTKPGRIFSIVWVITGVASCALFTSYMTTVLTSICMTEDVSLTATKVGVLTESEEHRFAMKRNSMPQAFPTINEVIDALKRREVRGILIDSYIAAEYEEQLKSFKRQMVIEYITSYGVVFLNEGVRFSDCVRDYVFSRQNEISEIIRQNVQLLEVSTTSAAAEKSNNLIDVKSPSFFYIVTGVIGILVVAAFFGTIWDIRKRQMEKLKKYNPHEDISLSEWRARYKCDFQQVLEDMQGECTSISDKCTSILKQLQSSNGIVCLRKKRSDDMRIEYDY